MNQRLAQWMVRHRLGLMIVGLCLTLVLLPLAWNPSRDRSVRAFFDPEHPRLRHYESVQEDFSGDTVCLAVYSDPQLLTAAGLDRLETFTAKLAAVPGILKATSLSSLRRPGNLATLWTLQQWFARSNVDLEQLRREILDCKLYADQFVGADGCTAAVVLLADPVYMGSGQFTQTLQTIRAISERNPQPARIVGAPVMINDVYDYLDQDAWILSNVSSLAMMGVILVLFRNLRWMALPILVVQSSLVWTKALMAVYGLDLSLMGSLTTSLLTVIGIGTAIHVAIRFQEELSKDHVPAAAMERTLTTVVPAVFWTCATTAVGFGSLAVSRVAPVRDFGWLMGAASMLVGIAAFLLIPGGALLGRLPLEPKAVPAERSLAGWLAGLGDWVQNHYLLASTMMFLAIGLSLVGLRRLEVETDFTRNFRANSTILEGYRFVEDRLGGAGLVELAFDAPGKPTEKDFERIRACQQALRDLPGVTKVIGLTDMIDFLSPTVGKLSPFASNLAALQLSVLRTAQPSETRQVWNPVRNRMRMLLRVREQQSTEEKSRLLEKIHATAEKHLGSSTVVTGLYVLLVHLIDSLLGDQLISFLLSSCLILAMTIVAFRSVRLGVVGFLPNLIPIALVMGSMGWLGFRINVATAMIGSISMGLTVDYSIHYLSRFREEREAGADFFSALRRVNRSTGKAMFCANLALMLGFGVLVFSNFLPSMQFGMLISLAMLGGLVGNLVMLPILLKIVYWVRRPRPDLFA